MSEYGLKYSSSSRLHGIYFDKNGKKFAVLCGLGGMGVGAMSFEWDDKYKKYPKCKGCMQGEPHGMELIDKVKP